MTWTKQPNLRIQGFPQGTNGKMLEDYPNISSLDQCKKDCEENQSCVAINYGYEQWKGPMHCKMFTSTFGMGMYSVAFDQYTLTRDVSSSTSS